ncbi:2-oxo-4-hydroxy-4-carboxy-5-ureidoimidazoline decarboxylase [Streptomyces sp. AV19]|uniref:2-oxo-4-hydroxy-4-carboxy-5-ureidoimidazoline decarboxylase n=1 Tax=Streptomyces sp. AV19 TaxID=2793068 RepID=UPI0018FE0B34|nr:2-oxo-4-hydroxy-4-carboxy-5-ureidoimidazoline decarboxylase [Streptomyces sp. AV19]MBH1938357.1 2-oxo-4-hydroxy-4-carboxy-5-ureidoimidazoline decarboxylase [Streptomyces sp. AV19]MDG4535007.1 2-oxo-4-hydroxy-4-carboxy-5-ureidoimidazoline decarboxylase [Streptomyces sp. AV19]
MTSSSTPGLARFNAADDGAARTALLGVCASTTWAGALLARRPYPDARTLLAASDAAVAALDEKDLAEAMSAHPPIGRPADGDDRSAREQRGMADAPADLLAEMLGLNLAYQEKFGHVFLVRASGLTAAELRDAVRRRIANSPDEEREIVRAELAGINRLRLAALVGADTATVSTHVLDTAAGRPAAGIAVALAARTGAGPWRELGTAATDTDGRCARLPPLPADATHARLQFDTEPYLTREPAGGAAFFPEVTAVLAVTAGEHHHLPLLLSPFGYSVYRGS